MLHVEVVRIVLVVVGAGRKIQEPESPTGILPVGASVRTVLVEVEQVGREFEGEEERRTRRSRSHRLYWRALSVGFCTRSIEVGRSGVGVDGGGEDRQPVRGKSERNRVGSSASTS